MSELTKHILSQDCQLAIPCALLLAGLAGAVRVIHALWVKLSCARELYRQQTTQRIAELSARLKELERR